jgi:acyl-CoA synthetase (AMP-forming)/AMP-acid ligase II
MTETFGGVFYNGESLDGVELAIIDGQIHLRGPMLMRAYRDESTPLTAEGWLPTGDAGSIVNGTLHVDGRISEMIISGGENIWPNAVEQVIIQHPLVSAVAVAGVPDNEWGERVVAWVVPQEATRPPTLEVLRDFVAQQLPKFYCPKEVNILPALPKTTLGKTDKRALIAL